MIKLHLGCGSNIIEGWMNLDMDPPPHGGIKCDLSKGLPKLHAPASFVYSEHFAEHLTRADFLALMKNVHSKMEPKGVIRVSTPSLETVIAKYKKRELTHWAPVGWLPKTPCQLVNEAMRSWEHLFIYDFAELRDLLIEAGFMGVKAVDYGMSVHPELMGLECRPNLGDLIVEAYA